MFRKLGGQQKMLLLGKAKSKFRVVLYESRFCTNALLDSVFLNRFGFEGTTCWR